MTSDQSNLSGQVRQQEAVEISVVIPVYQAEECMEALCQRLIASLERITQDYEIVLVDDASRDRSWFKIVEQAKAHPKIKGIRLSRNFGQHYALSAGFENARGNWVVVMDCDLQDPPEAIAQLYQKAKEGNDIVYAYRNNRKDSLFKRLTAAIYHKLISMATQTPSNAAMGSFTIISRQVVDAYMALSEYHRHYLIILRWVGFQSAFIDVEHCSRYAGKSSYTFSKLVQHALNGIIAQTNLLLVWTIHLGLFSVVVAFLVFLYVVYIKFRYATAQIGWASMMITMLFLGGAILVSTGVLGLYIDKIFIETKKRPLYIIQHKVNF